MKKERAMNFNIERRKAKRVKAILDTTILQDDYKFIAHECNTSDISEGGMRVIVSEEMDPGKRTFVRFKLPDSNESFIMTGLVAWTRAHVNCYETGIKFTSVSEDVRSALHNYVEGRMLAVA